MDKLVRRVIDEGLYVAAHGATVRETAKQFGVGKSTVHKDLTVRLPDIDRLLFERVRPVLDTNLNERHIRGGLATRRRFEAMSEEKKHAAATLVSEKTTH